MKKRILLLVTVVLLAFSTSAYAQSFSVAGKVSTLGLGGEGEYSITESLGIRGGFNYYTYSFNATESGIDYTFDFTLKSVPILLDWHPFKGSFRLTGGAMYNGNSFESNANYGVDIVIGGITYSAADVGVLTADIDFNAFVPYVGIGWDTTFGDDSGFGFSCDLGVLFQGAPQVDFTTTGLLAADSGFLADLAAEEEELQDSMDSFTIFPVVSVGISYRF